MTTTNNTTNLMPYSMDNNLQIKLQQMGKDVESFINRMGSMTDEEIAGELGMSLPEARDAKREFQRGQTGGYVIVD